MQLAEKQELVRLLMIYQNDLVNDDNANRKELMRCEKNNIPRYSKEAKFKHGIKSKYEHARIIVADLSNDISKELLENVKEKKMSDCTDCILDITDACPRGSGRAIDDDICENFYRNISNKTTTDIIFEKGYKKGKADKEKEIIDKCLRIVKDYFCELLDKHEEWKMSEIDEYALISNKTICKRIEKLKEETNG